MIVKSSLVLLVFWLKYGICDEAVCTINGKKSFHTVSDKFLSLCIDPAVLLSGYNISLNSLQLAQHISPAFINLAGPSTKYVEFFDDPQKAQFSDKLTVTQFMWNALNEWLVIANLTPIFALNDNERINDVWNPKPFLPLFDLTDKLNISCYWQLGYDGANRTEVQAHRDLRTLRNILDAFPAARENWKILGNQFSSRNDNRKIAEEVADAVLVKSDSKLEVISKPSKSPIPIWLVVPKSSHPVSFSSGIAWAKQIGAAANNGYEVIFRQPRLHEIFTDSPAYWVSLLHKTLMGRIVLEVKTQVKNVYAHCTKGQNYFSKMGAITVFVANDEEEERTVGLKVAGSQMKNIEVQSFILTAPNPNSTDTYLNGQKLTMDDLNNEKVAFVPKLRRARVSKVLTLSLPAKSVGFFVLPGARVPACITDDYEKMLIMQEINEDQNISFLDDSAETSTDSSEVNYSSFNDIYRLMEKEFESDKKYYNEMSEKPTEGKVNDGQVPVKVLEMHRKLNLNFLGKNTEEKLKQSDLELSSNEIRRTLINKAKEKAAAKNVKITSEELETLIAKTTAKLFEEEATSPSVKVKRNLMNKLKERLSKKPKVKRFKRSINMNLLRQKTGPLKTDGQTPRIQVAVRTHGQTSDELFRKESEVDKIPSEVYAQFANSDESTEDPLPTHKGKSRISASTAKAPTRNNMGEVELEDQIQFLTESDGFDSAMEDDLKNYHAFQESFGKKAKFVETTDLPRNFELWEMGEIDSGSPGSSPVTIKDDIQAMMSDEYPPISNDKETLDRTMKNLEDYFSNTRNLQNDGIGGFSLDEEDYGDLDSQEPKLRFRRDANRITKDAIQNYKREMKAKLKLMKKTYLNDRHKGIAFSSELENEDPVLLSIQEEAPTLTTTDRKQQHQIKMLKSKLAQHRKNHEKRQEKKKNNELQTYLTESEHGKFGKIGSARSRRGIDDDVLSAENSIDGFINDIEKDTEFMKPILDGEDGEYRLEFPSKDRISFIKKQGDYGVKFQHHTTTSPESSNNEIPKETPEEQENTTVITLSVTSNSGAVSKTADPTQEQTVSLPEKKNLLERAFTVIRHFWESAKDKFNTAFSYLKA